MQGNTNLALWGLASRCTSCCTALCRAIGAVVVDQQVTAA